MDALPDITMETIEEPPIEVEEGKIKIKIEEEPEKQEDPESEDDNEAILQQVEEKVKMKSEDIFTEPPRMKEVKVKKKRVLSEEHKKKLQDERVKALETRRRNSQQKKEIKELEKKVKENKLMKLKKEANGDIEPQPIQQPKAEVQYKGYSQEDLDKASFNAILGYEKIRKERKKKKKEDIAVEQSKRELRQQLAEVNHPAPKPQYSKGGRWDDFF